MKFITELSVTEKCNLACPYCYVTNKDQRMTKETLDASLKKVKEYSELAGCEDVHISWFGGEPLLNWELLEYGIPLVKDLGYSQNIISNLTLITPKIADFCTQHGVGVSWSFDGLSSNRSRPLRKCPENQGYRKILDLYDAKKDLILKLCNGCKVMVYSGNFVGMDKNLDFFLEFGIPNPDFTLVRDATWTSKDVERFKGEARKLADRWIWHIQNGTRCTVGFFMLYILDFIFGLTYGKRKFGCFACSHGCTVTSQGKFYPCARFASKDILEYSPVHNFKYYARVLDPSGFPECQACDLYHVCNAGCTFSQLREGNKPVPAVCDLLHILYAESARIVHTLRNNTLFSDIVKSALRGCN